MTSELGATCLSRREFVGMLFAASMLNVTAGAEGMNWPDLHFTAVNHWHQNGVGWYFREGVLDDKHYTQAYSLFNGVQKSIDALHRFPWLRICLEFDSHAYEAMQDEDARFVQESFRPLVSTGRIEIVGGTYSEPYASSIGWQSNVRQFLEGRAIAREVLGKEVDMFLAEEASFHPQMPQLLNLCGLKYACLEFQNDGSMPLLKQAIVNWKGLNGSTIPTIPNNGCSISLDHQNQSFAEYIDRAAAAENALLVVWTEIWPPGLDWGASYVPYAKGFQSLQEKGVTSITPSEFMAQRCKPGSDLATKYWTMDDAGLLFGWPRNRGLLWEKMGGWGYEGDVLLKENRRLEHELHTAELLLSLLPDSERSIRLRSLWKHLMNTQNHDCFIVSGYPGVYENVTTTNLEIVGTMTREVDSGIRQLREQVIGGMAREHSETKVAVICQNAAGIALRQPIVFEVKEESSYEYSLQSGDEKVELQRIEPVYANGNARMIGVSDLPPCGFKAYELKKRGAASQSFLPAAKECLNEYYTVTWNDTGKAFSIFDRMRSKAILFRPFSGEITKVNETDWASPDTGINFRAKTFEEVSYSAAVEAEGPVYAALAVQGNLLTLSTTKEPGAWVTARAFLYKGIPRVDIVTELHTNPRIGLLALAECEIDSEESRVVRDFPFGEEEAGPANDEKGFAALNYVRVESSAHALIVAHGGTQQFFCDRSAPHIVLKNMVARGTLKGHYRWTWSLTTGSSFTPAESYRFAEAFRGPIVQLAKGKFESSQSWLSVNDPAVVVFRLAVDSEWLTVWLLNYSGQQKLGELNFTVRLRACRRVDFEGAPSEDGSTVFEEAARRVRIKLSPWEMAALELRLR